jgi:hypothetical protein
MAWRHEAARYLLSIGYVVYSPMRHKTHLEEPFVDTPIPHTSDLFSDPFNRDAHDIARADYMIANDPTGYDSGTGPSVGTLVELGMGYSEGVYVISVIPADAPVHPFVAGASRDIVPELEDALRLLDEYRGLVA